MDFIPNEILVEILTYVPKSAYNFPNLIKVHKFVKLELVSKQWRDIIRSYRWDFVIEPKNLHYLIHLLTCYKFHKYNLFWNYNVYRLQYYNLDRLFAMMGHCTYVSSFDGLNYKVSDEHIKHLVNVEHLNLDGCYNIKGKILETLS